MKTLIKKATEKGFHTSHFIHSDMAQEKHYYLWLCELQKWLRDEHKIVVFINPFKDHASDVNDEVSYKWCVSDQKVGGEFLKTYESALEDGLSEALTLIKKAPNN